MLPGPKPDGIAILDFGGQYCHLIAKRVRQLRVYSEILPCDATPYEIEALGKTMKLRGIILSGSPASVKGDNPPRISTGGCWKSASPFWASVTATSS